MSMSHRYDGDDAISDTNITLLCLSVSPSIESLNASEYNWWEKEVVEILHITQDSIKHWWEREAVEVLSATQDSDKQRLARWLLSHDAD